MASQHTKQAYSNKQAPELVSLCVLSAVNRQADLMVLLAKLLLRSAVDLSADYHLAEENLAEKDLAEGNLAE